MRVSAIIADVTRAAQIVVAGMDVREQKLALRATVRFIADMCHAFVLSHFAPERPMA